LIHKVERPGLAQNPSAARDAEKAPQLIPRYFRLVAFPDALPELSSALEFGRSQIFLEAVDVDVVGQDAHAEFEGVCFPLQPVSVGGFQGAGCYGVLDEDVKLRLSKNARARPGTVAG